MKSAPSLPRRILRLLYVGTRRGGVIDVTRLLYRGPAAFPPSADQPGDDPLDGYRIESLGRQQLAEAIACGDAPASIGSVDQLADRTRALMVARGEGAASNIVAHLWLCRDRVEAADNFSRSRHLGTSLVLPRGCLFAYRAWTAPEHRGRGLVAAMLRAAISQQVLGGRALLTTVDWTNEPSRRAFSKLGMRDCGLIWRCGRGRWQLSLLPSFGRELGLRLAASAPGVKFNLGGDSGPSAR